MRCIIYAFAFLEYANKKPHIIYTISIKKDVQNYCSYSHFSWLRIVFYIQPINDKQDILLASNVQFDKRNCFFEILLSFES